MATSEQIVLADGSLDFGGGVDSIKTTTIASELHPNGLNRNQLAWLINGTVRDGGISARGSWASVGFMHAGDALYQGGYMYEPDDGQPYLVHAIGGNIYSQNMTTGELTLLSDPTTQHPPGLTRYYFCQAEQFLIIQAGDAVTLPLFWNGTTLRRSLGITNTAVAPGTPGVNEIPAATCMDYYMGRVWYAQGRDYSAGDIVRGASGTLPYRFRDAVLNVTENPLCIGGDGFTVPANDGAIRALKHSANIDTSTGQGRLFIFTRKAIYALTVPVTREDWINADTNNAPLQTVVQFVNGAVNDNSVVAANGDLFYQSLEPGIRSLMQAMRYFTQWGNIEISANLNRVLQFNDRSLLSYASGIVFDNRMIQTQMPVQLSCGVAHSALAVLDFVPISSFNRQTEPIWEGVYQGLNVLQLFVGDFGGRERAFAVVVSQTSGELNLWELSAAGRAENGENRIQWVTEFPAYNWGKPFDLKRLVGAELWVDRLWGTVMFVMEYRPDGQTCWNPWHIWKVCSPKNSAEDAINPVTYPLVDYGECYRSTMTLPKPMERCAECSTGRPANVGYQFQVRLTIKGYCRIRGLVLYGEKVERKLYANLQC